jgi:signal transduction histidine kinase
LNTLLSQEIAVKNRMFSIIAHDLRSPFTFLTGMTKMMITNADTYSREKLIEYAKIVNQSSHKIYDVMENLLEWSLFQLDGEKLDIKLIPIRDVVLEAQGALDSVAEEKGVKIHNQIGNQQVFADYHVVVTILRNLFSNAIKFSNNGDTVDVTVQDKGDNVEIIVSDSGAGIPEQTIGNLFAVDQKTTTEGTAGEIGSGLGLPLCADLVKKIGGSLRVESELGKGSRFIAVLPATCSD